MIDELRRLGTTVFLTTHYMDEAQHLADRVAILRDGAIVAEGPPGELAAGRHARRVPAAARRHRRSRWRRSPSDPVELAGERVEIRTDVAAAHALPADGVGRGGAARAGRAGGAPRRASRTCSWT